MRQRTRLVQRNLRNLLIMVDGQLTVGELVKRFGDKNATHAALSELLTSGYIVEVAAPPDLTTDVLPVGDEDRPEDDVPLLTSQITLTPVSEGEEVADSKAPDIEEIVMSAPEYESLPPPPFHKLAAEPPVPEPEPVAKAGWLDRARALWSPFARRRHAGPERHEPVFDVHRAAAASSSHPPVALRRQRRMPAWPLLGLYAFVALLVVLCSVLMLYPYERHLPQIEHEASARFRDTVKIGSVGFFLTPAPHFGVRDVVVGKDAYLVIGSAQFMPDLLSLTGERKALAQLELNHVVVKDSGLARLASVAEGRLPVDVRRLLVTDFRLAVAGTTAGGFEGEIDLSPSGGMESIHLANSEGTLKVMVRPDKDSFRLTANASGWQTPFDPKLTFQILDAEAVLFPSKLALSRIDGRIFDGAVEGKGVLEWQDGASFSGEFDLQRINAGKLLKTLSSDVAIDGELSAHARLRARSDKMDDLISESDAEGNFAVQRGTAKGFDLAEALRNAPNRIQTRGGETRFEQMSADFQWTAQNLRLTNLKIDSGLLKAGGNIGIDGSEQIAGTVDIELKSPSMTRKARQSISGSAKDPQLGPTNKP